MSGGLALARLTEERKSWRKNHSHGFVARPRTRADGTIDLILWECIVPGKPGSDWKSGHFPVTLNFNEEYPRKPPTYKFPEGFFHPNVFPSGTVCMAMLNEDKGWTAATSVKQILVGIQQFLDRPHPAYLGQMKAYELFLQDGGVYTEKGSTASKALSTHNMIQYVK